MNMFIRNLTLLLALAAVLPLTVQAFRVDSKLSSTKITSTSTSCLSSATLNIIEDLRAGAVDSDDEYDDEYDSDVEEEEEEEESDDEEEEEEVAPKLSASTIAAIKKAEKKAAMKKKQEIKKKVATSLSSSSPKKKSKKFSIASKIPYPIRAFMNPFTVIAMFKGYFASLVNIDYLQKDESQNLRSALQEKAKSTPSGGKKRGRKMKPGQAKTLSDLPQLNM